MAKKTANPLDDLAQGDPQRVMALMLWKARMREPDMYVQITEADIKGFDDCCRYLKARPQVRVFRPAEIPAQAAIPATGNRRAVAAREAIPARPYVMVVLTDEKGDVIKPVENNEADYEASQGAAQIRKARDQAPDLANRIVNGARTGEYSLSDIQDAANALLILARAV